MKIVNTMKFSSKNISGLGIALGVVYVATGATLIKVGAQSLSYGLGFRGKFVVYK